MRPELLIAVFPLHRLARKILLFADFFEIVTVTLGDELSGTIAQSIEADVTVTAPQASPEAVPAATETTAPAASEDTKEAPKQ